MRKYRLWVPVLCAAALAVSHVGFATNRAASEGKTGLNLDPNPKTIVKVNKSNEEWKRILTPEQFEILRQQGTEPPYTGVYWNNHEAGTYRCAACGLELFSSKTKFESHTGWPSFWQPIAKNHVINRPDDSMGDHRTEVVCARCGGHLGHVFTDGPPPTGLRYCMDSAALQFVKQK